MITDIAKLKTNFDQYIVRPANAFGFGGFVFDVEGDTTVTLSTEITDHYTENNTAIQDQIAVRPKKIVLRNYVGELVYRLDPDSSTPLQKVVQKLTILNSYLPALSRGAAQAKRLFEESFVGKNSDAQDGNFSGFLTKNQNTLLDLWSTVKNLTPPISRQQQAYMFFKALLEQKILVSVQTPFEFVTNMAVETIVASQGEDSRYISDFTITLKQIRTASTASVKFDKSKYNSLDVSKTEKPASTTPAQAGVSDYTKKSAAPVPGLTREDAEKARRALLQSQTVVNGGKYQGAPVTIEMKDLFFPGITN